MIITTNGETGIVTLTADIGKAIRRKGEDAGAIVKAILRRDDVPGNWEDCELVQHDPVDDTRYYTVDLLSSIGDVVGAWRYDDIKAALASERIRGVPVWDMLISGMFIPATDPRLAMIRNALVEAELVSDDEFDRILAIAASDEPVSESGAAEG